MKTTAVVAIKMESQMNHDSAMEHMHHQMNEIHQTDSVGQTQDSKHLITDCCKTMGHCLLTGCALVTTSNNIFLGLEKATSGVDDFYAYVVLNPFISFPYRPPIAA